jgi:16S rRNA (uracil1498-N3)-methyltransferase
MRRFFIDRSAIVDGVAVIEGELFRHLVKVLRLKSGARIALADGQGGEFAGVLASLEKERAIVRIEETLAAVASGAAPAITLIQGVPKGERMEMILQKGTELGVAGFVPFLSSRTILRLSGDKAAERVRRWERIVMEAARQSRRPDIPEVCGIVAFADAVASARQEMKLILWEGESERGLKEVVERTSPPPSSVAVLVGPEGGLSAEEAREARASGFLPVTLGPRILRTETTGLAVLSILQYAWGDVG